MVITTNGAGAKKWMRNRWGGGDAAHTASGASTSPRTLWWAAEPMAFVSAEVGQDTAQDKVQRRRMSKRESARRAAERKTSHLKEVEETVKRLIQQRDEMWDTLRVINHAFDSVKDQLSPELQRLVVYVKRMHQVLVASLEKSEAEELASRSLVYGAKPLHPESESEHTP
eukprot:CAMPEP_0184688516 /NCGR_PEP_ID=MMETSP0312-20130426/30141_1 /TAXON_ID=31354 /ORGANISM="Compsopogon coeruleus, Strain SAG 36.94" /LENGTH=169 /DNA_ID=CAMNT_0027145763 /DNA_START=334 /DNA_END=844 /DNA_ORIENTATION=-